MATAASHRFEEDQPETRRSTKFVAALEAEHNELQQCIAGLEAVMIRADGGGAADFSAIRLRIERANLSRTRVAWQACSYLIAASPSGQTEQLQGLQKREVEHAQAISDHIRRWPPRAVQDDWHGYRDATRKVLERIGELIALEQSFLLPLLRQQCWT